MAFGCESLVCDFLAQVWSEGCVSLIAGGGGLLQNFGGGIWFSCLCHLYWGGFALFYCITKYNLSVEIAGANVTILGAVESIKL